MIEIREDVLRLGIAYTTENRRELGLVLPQSIANISLPSLRRYLNALGLLRVSAERATAIAFKERLRIRAAGVEATAAGFWAASATGGRPRVPKGRVVHLGFKLRHVSAIVSSEEGFAMHPAMGMRA